MADGSIKILTDLSTEGFEKGISKMSSLAKTGLTAVSASVTAAGTALAAMGGYAYKVGSSFEAGMSEVAAISGATGKELEALTAKAKEMGASTKFSATESAEALKYMAMAGWDTDKMLSGLPGVMNLAAASGENLGIVSDIVTDAMTAFGLSADKSAHFADVLAQASSKSNTNVGLMGETFKYVAPVAGTLGYSIEDTAVAIGLMANAGIKGSQAGTALRSTLTRLAKPTDEVAGAMEDLGISLTDSEGNMKSFKDVVGDMRKGFQGLSKDQQTQYAATLAGQEGMSGLLAIVTASDEDFNALTEAINSSDGAAQQMADTMQDNLQGSITIAKSAIEGLGITVYEHMQEPLRDAVEMGTEYINQLNDAFSHGLDSGIQALGEVFSDIAVKAAELAPQALESGTQLVLSFLEGLEKNSKSISQSAIKIGQSLIKAFAELVPKIGKIGLSIIKEFAKQLFGYNIGKQVDTLGKTIENAFKKITTAVTRGFSKIEPAVEKIGKAFLDIANTGVNILSEAIAFLCENCDILVPILAAVAGGIAAWNIFGTVSGLVTALTTAIGAQSVAVGIATTAQNLWNIALTANPIGIVITAVAALAAGIAALCLTMGDATDTETKLAEINGELADTYADGLSQIGKFEDGVKNAKGILDTLNQTTLGESVQKQQELANKIEDCQNQITEIARTASNERRGLNEEEINSIRNLYEEMRLAKEQLLAEQQITQEAVLAMAQSTADSNNLTAEQYYQSSQDIIKSAQDAKDIVISTAEEQCTAEIANAIYRRDTLGELSAAEAQDLIDNANYKKEQVIAAAEEEYSKTTSIVADGYAKRALSAQNYVDQSAATNSKELELKKQYNDEMSALWQDYLKMEQDGTGNAYNYHERRKEIEDKYSSEIVSIREQKLDRLKNLSTEEIGSLIDMASLSAETYGNMNDATKAMVDQFLLDLSTLPDESRAEMNETLAGMNLELTEGGKLIRKNGEHAGEELIEGWTAKHQDVIDSVKGTVDAMNEFSSSSEIEAPKLLPISNAEEIAYSAKRTMSDILASPITQMITVAYSVSGGGHASGGYYAKGGVTSYAKGGVSSKSPKISKHAAGVFTKRTRLWDPITGINEYGEAGHEALLPLKESVFNEIAKGIVRQLSPAKLSGIMSQMRAAVNAEAANISAQIVSSGNYRSQSYSSNAERIYERIAGKMDEMLELLREPRNQYITFEAKTETPDEIARELRMQQRYGLAGE